MENYTQAHIDAKEFVKVAKKISSNFHSTLWKFEGYYYTQLDNDLFYYGRKLHDENKLDF